MPLVTAVAIGSFGIVSGLYGLYRFLTGDRLLAKNLSEIVDNSDNAALASACKKYQDCLAARAKELDAILGCHSDLERCPQMVLDGETRISLHSRLQNLADRVEDSFDIENEIVLASGCKDKYLGSKIATLKRQIQNENLLGAAVADEIASASLDFLCGTTPTRRSERFPGIWGTDFEKLRDRFGAVLDRLNNIVAGDAMLLENVERWKARTERHILMIDDRHRRNGEPIPSPESCGGSGEVKSFRDCFACSGAGNAGGITCYSCDGTTRIENAARRCEGCGHPICPMRPFLQ